MRLRTTLSGLASVVLFSITPMQAKEVLVGGTYMNGHEASEFAAEQMNDYCDKWDEKAGSFLNEAEKDLSRTFKASVRELLPPNQVIGPAVLRAEVAFDESAAPLCAITKKASSPLCPGKSIDLSSDEPYGWESQSMDFAYERIKFHTAAKTLAIQNIEDMPPHIVKAYDLLKHTRPQPGYAYLAVTLENIQEEGDEVAVSLISVPDIYVPKVALPPFSLPLGGIPGIEWNALGYTCYQPLLMDMDGDDDTDIQLTELGVVSYENGMSLQNSYQFANDGAGHFSLMKSPKKAMVLPPHLRLKHTQY